MTAGRAILTPQVDALPNAAAPNFYETVAEKGIPVPPTVIKATIKPNSRKGPLIETLDDGTLQLYVRAPAVEGKANRAAIELLAEHYGVPKSAVRLAAGATSRHKRFEIDR